MEWKTASKNTAIKIEINLNKSIEETTSKAEENTLY